MRLWPRKKVYIDNLPSTHDLRFSVLFLIGLAAVFGAIYGVGYAVAGDKVPKGTVVSDVDIGSLSRGEAETALLEELVPRLQRPITLQSDRGTFRIDPQNAGLTLDVEATVDEAMGGGDWDPRHMLRVLLGGDDVDAVVDIDREEFREVLGPIAKRVRIAPVDSRVTFVTGQPQLRYGTVGRTVDLEALQRDLVAALRDDERSIQLPLRNLEPGVTSDDADAFLKAVAGPAAAGPVLLKARRSQVVVPPEGFASALRATATANGLRLGIDAATAFRLGGPSRATLSGQPVDARVVLRNDRPVVVPGRSGFLITPRAWADGVLDSALRRPGKRSADLALLSSRPAFTAEEARSMGVSARIAQYAVRFPASVDRNLVGRAASQLDGVVLRPGGRLSFLNRVRLAGHSGVSTLVATATYNAALLAGLEVVDRSPSRRLADYLPVGRDALALRPRDDLRVENRLPYGVLLHATVEPTASGGVVRVEAWSSRYWKVTLRTSDRRDLTFPVPERRSGPACQPREGVPGFTVDVSRVRVRGDQRRDEVVSSRYAPVAGIICGPAPGAGQR